MKNNFQNFKVIEDFFNSYNEFIDALQDLNIKEELLEEVIVELAEVKFKVGKVLINY